MLQTPLNDTQHTRSLNSQHISSHASENSFLLFICATMKTRILLILFLIGCVSTDEPVKNDTDVNCMVIHMKYTECLWKKKGSPFVNYTFYSRFNKKDFQECEFYLVEDGQNVGCQQPEENLKNLRFNTFYTKLKHGDEVFEKKHQLENRVKLNPPINLTVEYNSDSNLLFKWKQIFKNCVESDVRYRVNNNNWQMSRVSTGREEYCINLPSNESRYELQVRSRVSDICGQSIEWSDWSEPVVWGSNNSTDPNPVRGPLSVWTAVMYAVLGVFLVLLLIMLLHHERIRIILIPVVPKPSLVPQDFQEWLDSSKGLKEVFKANYNERACPVSEYCPVSHSDSESFDSSDNSNYSNMSVRTDQTDCSESVPAHDPNNLGSSSANVFNPPEEQHNSV